MCNTHACETHHHTTKYSASGPTLLPSCMHFACCCLTKALPRGGNSQHFKNKTNPIPQGFCTFPPVVLQCLMAASCCYCCCTLQLVAATQHLLLLLQNLCHMTLSHLPVHSDTPLYNTIVNTNLTQNSRAWPPPALPYNQLPTSTVLAPKPQCRPVREQSPSISTTTNSSDNDKNRLEHHAPSLPMRASTYKGCVITHA